MDPKISAIVAMGSKNRAICEGQDLLWVIPDDHKRLKQMTMGHTLIMGRKTYESIGHPLRGRVNIVLTRNKDFNLTKPEGFEDEVLEIAFSSEDALKKAKQLEQERFPENGEVFIFGGGEIYKEMLDRTDRIYATLVDSEKDGTAHFPEYESSFRKILNETEGEWNGLRYRWVDLER